MSQYAILRGMPATKNAPTSSQKINSPSLQAPRDAGASRAKGLKRPSPELGELLRLANLVPTGEELPLLRREDMWLSGDTPGAFNLQGLIAPLPPPIRLDILEHVQSKLGEWAKRQASTNPEQRTRIARADDEDRDEHRAYTQRLYECHLALTRYQTILDARENLRRLIEKSPRPLRFQLEACRGENDKLILQPAERDWTVRALLSAELSYLSRCAYSKCENFFYAVRRGQPGCTPEHSDIIRKQRKRKRDRENREFKEAKKKRATTARER